MVFLCQNPTFCDGSLNRIRIPHWFGSLDPDPHQDRYGSEKLNCVNFSCRLQDRTDRKAQQLRYGIHILHREEREECRPPHSDPHRGETGPFLD
jgi:hypothetical protein